MRLTGVEELQQDALSVIRSLEQGEDIIFTKDGKPIAITHPIDSPKIQSDPTGKGRITLQGIVDDSPITDTDIEEAKSIWK